MKPVVTMKKQLRKETLDAIIASGRHDLNRHIIAVMQKKMEALGPPPLGYRYEVTDPRFEFNPEEGKYTVTSYIKTVPIE